MMWDFLPVNLNEIKQIEVIRGPASAVWGANALYGVVNVITKSPREMQGTSAVVRRRRVRCGANGGGSGPLWYVERHARAGRQRSLGVQDFGRRLLAGSDVPADRHRSVRPPGGLHRHDARPIRRSRTRAPRSRSSTAASTTTTRTARKLSFSGGVAGTDGIMHTGIGPFDITSGTVMGYGKANYTKQGLSRAASSRTSSTATPTTCSTQRRR